MFTFAKKCKPNVYVFCGNHVDPNDEGFGRPIVCFRCLNSEKHGNLVAGAQKNNLAQADEMLKRSSQLMPLAFVGQSVFIKVLEFDRTNILPPNVIGFIFEGKNELFVIGTKLLRAIHARIS